MICPHCGAENKTAARFCNECGAGLAVKDTGDLPLPSSLFTGSENAHPVTQFPQDSPKAVLYSATTPVSCHSCGQANFAYELNCKGCGAALSAWHYISPEELKHYTCWKCGGRYVQVFNNPNKGTGCIVVVLGILFAPVLIGIILIIYGVGMMNETMSYCQCRSCGLTLPA